MNSLSWFVYLIQLVDQFRDACGIILTITIIAAIFTGIQFLCRLPDSDVMHLDFYKNAKEEIIAQTKKVFRIEIILFLVCFLSLIFVPSRQTMLLIAGSEMGEKLVKSDTVKDVVNPGLDLLKSWIRNETAKLNAPEKPRN
jgi:hypothetical protein